MPGGGLDARPGRMAYRAGWALVLSVAAYLRLWSLGAQVIIDDEWHALNKLTSAGYGEILRSFGHADHSIPLTIYYKLLSDTIGLAEWGMRMPQLLFGLATVIVVPVLFRAWTTRAERLAAGALIAVSPLLVYYSRLARPYAITTLLCVIAAVCFYRWWRSGGAKPALAQGLAPGLAYGSSTVLAAWLHPVSLAYTLAPFVWAGVPALARLARQRDASAIGRLMVLGVAVLVPLAAVLGPPLWHDLASLKVKAGADYPAWETLVVAWELAAGSGNGAVSLAVMGLAVFGAWRLYRRDAGFWFYQVVLAAVALLMVMISGAEWLHHGLVFARYLSPVHPVMLVCVAVGLSCLAGRSSLWMPRGAAMLVRSAAIVLAVALLFAFGPLPEQYQGRNQFTGHLHYQFDYDRERSIYRFAMANISVPEYYERIRDAAQGEAWDVVEAPWHLDSPNPFPFYQQVHQLPVKIGFLDGLCGEGNYGEYPVDAQGLEFRHFVHLKDLLREPGARRFLVMHRETAVEGWLELPPVEPCIESFRARHGEPWIETPAAVVFRFGGGES